MLPSVRFRLGFFLPGTEVPPEATPKSAKVNQTNQTYPSVNEQSSRIWHPDNMNCNSFGRSIAEQVGYGNK